jgi:hypothetical protein
VRRTLLPLLLLLLPPAAHGADLRRHHPRLSTWHFGPHDGRSPHDFGRSFRRFDGGQPRRDRDATPGERRFGIADVTGDIGTRRFETHRIGETRLDTVAIGHNGAQVRFGLIHGRHPGFRFAFPF